MEDGYPPVVLLSFATSLLLPQESSLVSRFFLLLLKTFYCPPVSSFPLLMVCRVDPPALLVFLGGRRLDSIFLPASSLPFSFLISIFFQLFLLFSRFPMFRFACERFSDIECSTLPPVTLCLLLTHFLLVAFRFLFTLFFSVASSAPSGRHRSYVL